ncbi:MAG: hypothetical protein QOF48_2962, partial [Verrucomicrobiota bacterium]
DHQSGRITIMAAMPVTVDMDNVCSKKKC